MNKEYTALVKLAFEKFGIVADDNELAGFIDAVIESQAMDPVNARVMLATHLKMWVGQGIAAPANELQSIQSWLQVLGAQGPVETKRIMQKRMILLTQAATEIYNAGSEEEDRLGIYSEKSRGMVEALNELTKVTTELDALRTAYKALEEAHKALKFAARPQPLNQVIVDEIVRRAKELGSGDGLTHKAHQFDLSIWGMGSEEANLAHLLINAWDGKYDLIHAVQAALEIRSATKGTLYEHST